MPRSARAVRNQSARRSWQAALPWSSGPAALKQAPNCLTIDRWYSPLKPIERGKPVVVSGGRIGAAIEKNLDGFHEACFGGIVQRGRPSAVGHLDSLAPVIYSRAMPQKRRDVLGIVLSTLISGARKLDPSSRSVDTSSSAREHRRQFGMRDPTTCRNCRCVRAAFEEHRDNRDVLVRNRHAERVLSAAKGLLRL
jgi:hypothetical protein